VRAGTIAARDERQLLFLDDAQRFDDVLGLADPACIELAPDEHEIIVHHRVALHAEALGNELLLFRLGMHENDVGITTPRGVERLAGSQRYDLHRDAGARLEQGQQVPEQPGVLGRGRRGHSD
jgi:hypothetical protein